ncbi:MAG TPA: hypothetical protein VE093_29260 [Polyangiaceae bacterium]|nr:hypothetical protein [Polyangiaceae bacterium]
MGDRANYAILNKGKLSVFYAHWGGPTVPRELKEGPAACERFIRSQERVRSKAFLEFSFMEGGIALDKENRRALVFGGPGGVNYDPRVQARLLERLRPIWERDGWSLDWARRYAYDFVMFLGLDGSAVEDDLYLGHPAAWEEATKPAAWMGTLIARARKEGEGWEIRQSPASPGRLIHHGARLIEGFDDFAPVEAGEVDPDDLQGVTALLFNEAKKKLVIVAPLFAGLNAPHSLAKRAREVFEGWSVELDLDLPLPDERLRARGIALGAPKKEEPEEAASEAAIDDLIDRVLAYQPEAEIERLTASAEQLVAGVVAEAEARGETVKVLRNPHVSAKKKPKPAASAKKKSKPAASAKKKPKPAAPAKKKSPAAVKKGAAKKNAKEKKR